MNSDPYPRGRDARAAYEDYLGRLRAGEALDFDAYCEEHEDLAIGMRILHSLHESSPLDGGSTGSGPATPAAAMLAVDPGGEALGLRPGDQIGPYRLVEVVGSGGMGTVFLAEQSTPVTRLVALKVIKLGVDTREVVARFRAEQQALAVMDHPHIARVFDAGATEKGQPYFVMEYVRGVPITTFCDQLRLGVRQRLALFQRVCQAVQHAHQKGIIHRDIKPSNILVSGGPDEPVPRLIDFGIAKATNEPLTAATLCTSPGQIIGTPEYMSPEQAGASDQGVDTRTDIYSLGVVLYTLLAGALPFDPGLLRRGGYSGLQRTLMEVDPPRPSTRLHQLGPEATAVAEKRRMDARSLGRQIRGDLDWITMKAIDKDRSRRYASASELAADIERYLKDETVVARPPDAIYRALKLVRRNRGVVGSLLAVGLALLAGLVVSLVLYRRATERLDEVLRLADLRDLEEYRREADALWPASSANIGPLAEWLDRARGLAARLDIHRATLERLRAAGRGQGTVAAGTPASENSPEGPALSFLDPRDRWWHDTLEKLVRDLEQFQGEAGTIAGVAGRLEFARQIRKRTIEDPAREWEEARTSIASSPAYGGLTIGPQEGLVPLGPDPDSKLWEFAHLETGAVPERGEAGKLAITPETGLVFVLLPPGTVAMGAVLPVDGASPASPNVDAWATSMEAPVHRVELDAQFLSKFEMTQGQWLRFTASNPGFYAAGRRFGGRAFDGRNPVENVTWESCQETLKRLGLVLPTEAQWEYAARAGTTTVWWTGNDVATLQGAANLADSYFKSHGGGAKDIHDPEIDDGHFAHAPVGSYRANAFGLHDVAGNVWEWCRDGFDAYTRPVRPGDGLRDAAGAPGRVYRGGSFGYPARYARSAVRMNGSAGFSHVTLGVRPARDIDR